MGGGDGCMYVWVDLLWLHIQNFQAWGLGELYIVGHVYLENLTLVYCGDGLESYCVGGGDGCRYVGVNVS